MDVSGEARDEAGEAIRVTMVMGFFGVKRGRALIVFLIVFGVDDVAEMLVTSRRSPRTGRRVVDAFDVLADVELGVSFGSGIRDDDEIGIREDVADAIGGAAGAV